MSKNVIIAIVVIVIIIAGVIWYMGQNDTPVDAIDNEAEVIDVTGDAGAGSFVTEGADAGAAEGEVDAAAEAQI
ncbi:MAG: hypothetical protein A2589_00310 [Candidatus Vogelbacteria bacterium RIFOXYD1_FULL_46_19]|uniref:Uncharacterized protein n=1 Tax=Candidatus Vogelbacteria bacterium RIFOXYD1_FULL_46_19 TaxID=1802439 RepID=A0A1G2QJI4_9BACT|nr:MAG: hypothetical protein A2589_00310 [Candidatus Vogelbacteria bacterium RIFOXYD1_FULL_46_19]